MFKALNNDFIATMFLATSPMRYLYGFGQSAPAILLALRQAEREHLIDDIHFR